MHSLEARVMSVNFALYFALQDVRLALQGVDVFTPSPVVDHVSRRLVVAFWEGVGNNLIPPGALNFVMTALMAGDFADDLVMDGVAGNKTREALNVFLALGDQPPVLQTK